MKTSIISEVAFLNLGMNVTTEKPDVCVAENI